MRQALFISFLLIFSSVYFPKIACASEKAVSNPVFASSGLSIPRFVSLSNGETNVRTGPGQHYPIKWVYNRSGMPVEVILEFEHWRKIRDINGDEGWVFHTLLSGERNAFVRGDEKVFLYEKPFDEDDEKSRPRLVLEPAVQVGVDSCNGAWCRIHTSGFSGWIKRNLLWGVYEHENFD